MKIRKIIFFQAILVTSIILAAGCSKSGSGDTSSLYVPTSADATANATLQELTQGRALYISNCNACHQLYNPDNFTPSQWSSIISSMSPRTGMSASEVQLVTKYLRRGN
jgi:mono/diheme cytochrome c family protein